MLRIIFGRKFFSWGKFSGIEVEKRLDDEGEEGKFGGTLFEGRGTTVLFIYLAHVPSPHGRAHPPLPSEILRKVIHRLST
jgi:hypothetical protein